MENVADGIRIANGARSHKSSVEIMEGPQHMEEDTALFV